MTAPLDRDRLAKICGLFSSAHDGERAAAALLADQLVRTAGLTWQQIIPNPVLTTSTPIEPADDLDNVDICLANLDALTPWELDFVHGVAEWRGPLSEKQIRLLRRLAAKARGSRYEAAA
jgi:hypothetical protein